MDDALSKALNEKAELEARLKKLNMYIEIHGELFGKSGDSANVENNKNKARRRVRPGMGDMVKRAAVDVIRAVGRPMQRGELTDQIAQHVTIVSADPANYVSTVLYRNPDTFEKIEGRGYWLKGHPLPDNNQPPLKYD